MMADDVDLSQDRIEITSSEAIKRIRDQAAVIPSGHPGECELCGQPSKRLVDEVCAPCRDEYKLP